MHPIRKAGVIAFAVLLLFLQEWQLAGITVRTWLVYLYTIVMAVIFLAKKKNPAMPGVKGIRKRKWETLDCLLGIFLAWNILQITTDSLGGMGCKEANLLTAAVIMLFFVSSMEETLAYADCLLICSAFIMTGLLWHFLVNTSFSFNLQLLLRDEQALTSFLLLVGMLAAGKYCEEEDKAKRYFYFMVAMAGYFLLFTGGNIMGITLMGLFFPILLLIHTPQRKFIRRAAQSAFSYFFLCANMPLAAHILPALASKRPYSMENGVWMDLIIAVICVVFLSYWDKLPSEENEPLYGMQKKTGQLFVGICALLFILLVMGNGPDGMETGGGIGLLQQYAAGMREYCAQHNGTFYDVLAGYGLCGGLLLFCIISAAVDRMKKQLKRKKTPPLLAAVFAMYLLQSVFFSQQAVTAPVYAVLLAEALYGSHSLEN